MQLTITCGATWRRSDRARSPREESVPSSTSSPATGAVAAWAAGLLRIRWLARAPVGLYRARLGFLLGSRLLMLEHLGRKSGARRYAVLEVVAHPRPGTYVAASGFGTRAQWFRNVRANPHVRVYAGRRRPAPATARLLASDETAAALAAYAARHPRVGRVETGLRDNPRRPDKRPGDQPADDRPRTRGRLQVTPSSPGSAGASYQPALTGYGWAGAEAAAHGVGQLPPLCLPRGVGPEPAGSRSLSSASIGTAGLAQKRRPTRTIPQR